MLRVIVSVFNRKDITIIGREYLFPNLKCGEIGEMGIWMVGFDSLKEFCSLCKAKPMNERTVGYLVGTFACLDYGLRLSLFEVLTRRS